MPKKENIEEVTTEVTTTEAAPAEKASLTLTCPHCGQEIEITTPAHNRRGQLSGLNVEEMTDDQLAREIINAKSVLYKAEQRGAGQDTILKNKARVDTAMAEKAKRHPVAEVTVTEVVVEAVAQEI